MEVKGDMSAIVAGLPAMVPDCNIAITQPKVKDVCAFGEDRFFTCVFFFSKAEEMAKEIKMGNSQLEMLADFQILMIVLDEDSEVRDNILDFFHLILPSYIVQFDAGSINFRLEEKGKIVGQLNPMTFSSFQKMLEQLFVPTSLVSSDMPDYNPANDQAAAIAAKLKAGREKVAQEKQQANGGEKQCVFGHFSSILAIGMAMDINIFFNYTPFQLFDAYIRHNKKRAFDFYQKVSTTPLMDVSKLDEPDDWTAYTYTSL